MQALLELTLEMGLVAVPLIDLPLYDPCEKILTGALATADLSCAHLVVSSRLALPLDERGAERDPQKLEPLHASAARGYFRERLPWPPAEPARLIPAPRGIFRVGGGSVR